MLGAPLGYATRKTIDLLDWVQMRFKFPNKLLFSKSHENNRAKQTGSFLTNIHIDDYGRI